MTFFNFDASKLQTHFFSELVLSVCKPLNNFGRHDLKQQQKIENEGTKQEMKNNFCGKG